MKRNHSYLVLVAMAGAALLAAETARAATVTLSFDDFALNAGQSYSQPQNVGVGGIVEGFTFTGAVSGIMLTDSSAADLRLDITAPDGQTFSVGGSGQLSGDHSWNFTAPTLDGVKSQTFGSPPFLSTDAPGTWGFTFVNAWSNATSPMNWTNVLIDLHLAAGSEQVGGGDTPDEGSSIVVPAPAAVWGSLALLGLLGVAGVVRRRRMAG